MFNNSKTQQDFFFWALILCLFFEIVRAADVYDFLSSYRAQLLSYILLIGSSVFANKRSYKKGNFNFWLFFFSLSLITTTLFAYDPSVSWKVTSDYLKLVFLVFLINYCIETEFLLKSFLMCLFLLVFLYLILCFREFLLGQHDYDMGVIRLIGWEGQTGPNRVAYLTACFLPLGVLMLKKESFVRLNFYDLLLIPQWFFKLIVWTYFPLSIIVILLTNSRTGLVLLIIFGLFLFFNSQKKMRIICVIAIIIAFGYNFLPESTKNRYRSIFIVSGFVDYEGEMTRVDEVTQESAQGRLFGLKRGIEIFKEYPVFGVGPGGFQLLSGNKLQAHNLIGQLFSETGILGIFTFSGLLGSILFNLKKVRIYSNSSYILSLASTIKSIFFIMMVGSIFSHTLFFLYWPLWGMISLLSLSLNNKE